MPLQNRVTPFGEIVAIAQRGTLTGNRGIIHDPASKTLLTRRWSSKAWIICLCQFRGRRREVMGGRSWTELFFLDEAVALAAGHRPCFFCQREAARGFQAAWANATGDALPSAPTMDAVLHSQRLQRGAKRIHPLPCPLSAMPDGAVVVASGSAFTLAGDHAYRWTEQGYGKRETIEFADGMLTPPATFGALQSGYRPRLHPAIASP